MVCEHLYIPLYSDNRHHLLRLDNCFYMQNLYHSKSFHKSFHHPELSR